MYVFVYDWQVRNALKSNHLELVVPSGKSYLCFFEDAFGQLDFRVLKLTAETGEYMTPMRILRHGEYRDIVRIYRKKVGTKSVTLFRSVCFRRCLRQSMRRLTFGASELFHGPNRRRDERWLPELIKMDTSWKRCSDQTEESQTSYQAPRHMAPRSTTTRRL